jgi:hypothetical protein
MSRAPTSQHKVIQHTLFLCLEDPDWTPPDPSARPTSKSPPSWSMVRSFRCPSSQLSDISLAALGRHPGAVPFASGVARAQGFKRPQRYSLGWSAQFVPAYFIARRPAFETEVAPFLDHQMVPAVSIPEHPSFTQIRHLPSFVHFLNYFRTRFYAHET